MSADLALFGLTLTVCLTGALVVHRYVIRPAGHAARTARHQQQRADRLAAINARLGHWVIDDGELADHLAIWADQQAGLDRLRNAIDKQQREEEQQ